MNKRYLVVALALTALCAVPTFASTILVPDDFSTIGEAIGAAVDGDEVVVSPGIYNEHDLDLQGKAIIIRSTAPGDDATVNGTIIDAQGLGRHFHLYNGEGPSTRIVGLTLRNGFIDTDMGGAICCDGASPVIDRCVFESNDAPAGGGIACINGSQAYIIGCVLDGNIGTGAGVHTTDADITVQNCIFKHGRVHSDSGNDGAGIHIVSSTATIANSIFAFNRAEAPYSNWGGAIDSRAGSIVRVDHCTLYNNYADNGGSALNVGSSSVVTVQNSIIWGHSGNVINIDAGGTLAITYTDIQGGYAGEGNIDVSPNFTSAMGLHLLLAPGSPCIDAGTGPVDGWDWCWFSHAYCQQNTPAPDMGAYGGTENLGWMR